MIGDVLVALQPVPRCRRREPTSSCQPPSRNIRRFIGYFTRRLMWVGCPSGNSTGYINEVTLHRA